MASAEHPGSVPPESDRRSSRGFVRRLFAESGALVRLVHRDPEHVAEPLTLFAVDRIAGESATWAESARRKRPDTPPAGIAEELRLRSARIARIDGAISGTPFLLALVPGYISYLWQECA